MDIFSTCIDWAIGISVIIVIGWAIKEVSKEITRYDWRKIIIVIVSAIGYSIGFAILAFLLYWIGKAIIGFIKYYSKFALVPTTYLKNISEMSVKTSDGKDDNNNKQSL